MQIDAHQHFWHISRGDYDWMNDEVVAIRRDILPPDLAPTLARHGIDGTVLVQAADTVAETDFMISLAARADFIKGVVGWVDLEQPSAPDELDRLSQSAVFKGVRPMLQDIADTDWILRPAVRANLAEVAHRGLRFDALVQPRHLPAILEVAKTHPTLPIVIDHCAKPVIAGGTDAGDGWRGDMATLAGQSNVFCKVSGLANEYGGGWSADTLRPVVSHVLDAFGPDRIMWGSDWPVLELAGTYDGWRAAAATLFDGLSGADRAAVMGGTATRFYGLEQPA